MDLRYNELFLVLSSELKTLQYYFGKNPKYSQLLEVFVEYREDEYNDMPKQSELINRFGISRTQLMELMHDLCQDFKHSIFQAHRYKIERTEYYVSAETRDDHHWQVGLDYLEHIPKKGDVFSIPFIKTEYDSGYFKVKEVHHSVVNCVHTISIFVSSKSDDDESSRFNR
ncbi:hypothetical protein [Gracilimonas sp. BCB1]|uniref:hypothetical protein n=1 Tax=Gracilimonas sp. BCB1 TaxID=3152362 RepID=UPI0032D992C6